VNAGKNRDKKWNILAFGFERRGYEQLPGTMPGIIEDKRFVLQFERFDTDQRFEAYDGVVLFKGAFEAIHRARTWDDSSYLTVNWDRKALTQRRMELTSLLQKPGFVCFLVDSRFLDYTEEGDTSDSDLAKVILKDFSIYRENFSTAQPSPDGVRPEFGSFLDKYGAAYAYYTTYAAKEIEGMLFPIARTGGRLTGFALADRLFFLPCHTPKAAHLKDFLTVLANALIDCRAKLAFEIPPWLQEFRFPIERQLVAEEKSIQARLAEIRSSLDNYDQFKVCLCQDGPQLVKSVSTVLTKGFGFRLADADDEFIEDRCILGSNLKPEVLVEIKGTTRGVKREHINQADSHRERRNLPADFPSIVIINTHAKESKQLADKDRPIANEQIVHAHKLRVLVLRTLDLVRLYAQKESGTLDSSRLLNLLKSESGWLKASESGFEIVHEVSGDKAASVDSKDPVPKPK